MLPHLVTGKLPASGHDASRVRGWPREKTMVYGEGGATARSGKPARERPLVAAMVPYLAVLVCAVAGVYISWSQGSAGGGRGGAIAGGALLVAAALRLLLPPRVAGLLASRHRVTDVLTLAAFGAGLLIVGLVLPRLGPLSAQGKMAGPR
jgi:hypothetical protein